MTLLLMNQKLSCTLEKHFLQDSSWVKKEGDEDFHIPMGFYDGAEIWNLYSK